MSMRSDAIETNGISISQLRGFLISNGFTSMGQWGKYLERYHLDHAPDQFDVLVPTTKDISDYADRMRDAILDLSTSLSLAPSHIVKQVSLDNFRLFRLRAHPGREISSLPFDEGYALLSNSKKLIKASAVSAYSTGYKKIVRGKTSAAVDNYMDRIRIGQSEVGSYIFNILLPSSNTFFSSNEYKYKTDDVVLESLEKNINLAQEISKTNRVPSLDRLEKAGMSANFCEALYQIIDWSENIILEISKQKDKIFSKEEYIFDRKNLSVIEKTAIKLSPDEQPQKKSISGTIIRLSETANKRRGSIDLLVKIDNRRRSVRIAFEPIHRETIITAFKDKDFRFLNVSGFLKTERNGHLILEKPEFFDVSKRGSLL